MAKLHEQHSPIFVKVSYYVPKEKTGKKYIKDASSGIMGDLNSLSHFLSELSNISIINIFHFYN